MAKGALKRVRNVRRQEVLKNGGEERPPDTKTRDVSEEDLEWSLCK